MTDVAHLSFRGGGLLLPAHTPYERELLIEYIEATTKRHGQRTPIPVAGLGQ